MSDNIGASEGSLELTASIVSAYVSNNSVPMAALPELVASVHNALQSLGPAVAEPAKETAKPAVPIKKSVTPDYIISLEDGRPYKSLKRHLRASYDMTPDQYRQKWSLPKDYPMVAPNYSAKRSALAKSLGLGRKAAPPKGVVTKRGRPAKAG